MSNQTQTRRIDNPGLAARPRAPEAPKPEAPPVDEPEGDLPAEVTTKPAVAEPPVEKLDPAVAKLSKVYEAYGEKFQQIRFRRPVGKDLRIGQPFRPVVDGDGKLIDREYDFDRVIKYIFALSSPPVPVHVAETFELEDMFECGAAITHFFFLKG